MNNEILQSLIDEDFGYKHEGSIWGRAERHSSLVVNEEKQKWYWNSENKGGDALAYLIQIRGLDKKKAREILDIRNKIVMGVSREDETIYYNPYEKLIDVLWTAGKDNRKYWYDRKLTDRTIDRYRLGFYEGWSLVPLYLNDKLINFQMRRDSPEKKIRMWYKEKVWHPVLLNSELLNLIDKVYIVEGLVDALLLTQEGIPAVSQTGGGVYWSTNWYPLFSRIKTIYYIADNDKVGSHAAKRVASSLGEDKVLIYRFKDKKEKFDSGDFFKEGGTANEFKELVEGNAKNIYEIGD